MKQVDVVIPHYGEDELLDACEDSFLGDDYVNELRVINNNVDNSGFTKAVNVGIRKSHPASDYIAIVNNDTIALENPFGAMVQYMDKNKNCAISGPMIVHSENHDRIIHAGGEQIFPNGVHRGGVRSLGQCTESGKVKWLSFVVVMIRKSAIREVGLLDERFFLIGSDSDYCLRMRAAGFDCCYVPESVWSHKVGESGKPSSNKSALIQRKDMWWFHKKWMSGGAFDELDKEVMK